MSHLYELWDVISYGEGESAQPIFLYKSYDDFSSAYFDYVKRIESNPCVVVYKNKNIKEEKNGK